MIFFQNYTNLTTPANLPQPLYPPYLIKPQYTNFAIFSQILMNLGMGVKNREKILNAEFGQFLGSSPYGKQSPVG